MIYEHGEPGSVLSMQDEIAAKVSARSYQDRARIVLDKHRNVMVECLAAAIEGDRSGKVGFDFHLSEGDPKRLQCNSDFSVKIS